MTGFDELGKLADAGLGRPARARIAEQRRRFVSATARAEPERRGVRLVLFAAAALACLVAVGGGLALKSSAVVTATSAIVPADTGADRWLEGDRNPGAIRLLDGAFVRLSASARARVQGLDSAGPLVTVEGGRVEADLEPRLKRRWTFLAGAYRIQVLGTAFSIDFEPASGAIEVAVDRGRVRITGGKIGLEGVTLDAGQRFRADGAVVTFGADAPQGAVEAPEQAPATSASARPRRPAVGWHALFERGDYVSALATAESEGFDGLMARLGPGELGQLADTARLAGNPARSRQALMAVRSRFQGSSSAGRAAFLLGRMDGSPHWFETYLAEQPNGPYAAEAAGRLVVAYRDHGDLDRARTAAERYLARYPGGPYAELARSLVVGLVRPR